MVNIARRIHELQNKTQLLIWKIEQSDHPNAEAAADDLFDQCFGFASAEVVISGYLTDPDAWEQDGFRIRHKRASRAAASRKAKDG